MLSRRSIIFAAIAASAALAAPAFGTETRTFDLKSFTEAQKAGKPIFVGIHASWCPTCKAQDPILSELMLAPKFKDLVYFRFRSSEGRREIPWRAHAIDADRIQGRKRNRTLSRRHRPLVDRRASEQDTLTGQ